MDETTYSTPAVIEALNREFVPIRVDNDLRPDVNARYNMGGWPTTAFLTPQGDILAGATYMPPEQMVGALGEIVGFYRTRRPEIAAKVLEMRKRSSGLAAAQAGALNPSLVDTVLNATVAAYDETYGGFGTAPKFPQAEALALLAEQAAVREQPDLLRMARFTLEQMATGGTYDQVAGGFFRYSTTQDWSVPHFEKMLEDHGLLVAALGLTGQAGILDPTARYLDEVLRDPDTGLYGGSQDADEHYYSLDGAGRAELEPPYVDRRVYSSWNCMLATGYLEVDRRLARPELRENARTALTRLFAERHRGGHGLGHSDQVEGQLGDQVWGLLAAIRAYSADLGQGWLERAKDLAEHLETAYLDDRFGGYFDTPVSGGPGRLDERLKPLPENSIAAFALSELDVLAGDPDSPYRRRAERALESVAELPGRYGIMAAAFARALDRLLRPAVKVTTSSPALTRAALAAYPYAVIEPGEERRAIVCVGTLCLAPVETEEELGAAVHDAAHARA